MAAGRILSERSTTKARWLGRPVWMSVVLRRAGFEITGGIIKINSWSGEGSMAVAFPPRPGKPKASKGTP